MPEGLVKTLADLITRLAAFFMKVWKLLGGENVENVPEDWEDIPNLEA